MMSEADTAALVDKIIAEVKPASASEFGKVMKAVIGAAGGKSDGQLVSKLVKEKLALL